MEGGDFTVTLGVTEPDETEVFGGKVGFWFEALPWFGAEMDAGHMSPDLVLSDGSTRVDVDVYTVGFNALVRFPGILGSVGFPRGRFQPYVGFGPALFVATTEESQAPVTPGLTLKVEDTSVAGGVQAEAGLKIFLLKFGLGEIAVFGAYRFAYFNLNAPTPLETTVGGIAIGDQVGSYDQDFLVNSFAAGASLHW